MVAIAQRIPHHLSFGAVIVIASGSGVICCGAPQQGAPPSPQGSPIPSAVVQTTPLTAAELFVRLSPSVFVVLAKDATGQTTALGTGIAISREEIVTNSHVVAPAVTLQLVQSGRNWPAFVKKDRPDLDLALLTATDLIAQPVNDACH
jgi:S1-C subfamily serine protease